MNTEERNIENTHPAELKRIQRKEVQDNIDSCKRKMEFSLISTAFFLFVMVMVLANQVLVNYIAIVPGVIAIVFAVKSEFSHEELKSERISQRMLELFFEENNL